MTFSASLIENWPFRQTPRKWRVFTTISIRRELLLILMIVLTLLLLYMSISQLSGSPAEEGPARIIRVIGTNTGLGLIIYYGSHSSPDAIVGPLIKVFNLTSTGKITDPSSAQLLTMSEDLRDVIV